MQAIDLENRSLEEVIEEILKTDNINSNDEKVIAHAKVQRLRGELRKYILRPTIYEKQIAYIRGEIEKVQKQYSHIEFR